jgi:TonB family protein
VPFAEVMRRSAAVAAVVAALLPASVAAEAGSPQVDTTPDWVRRPGGPEIDTAYPKTAAFLAIAGKAAIRCDVATSGALERCTVLDESPKGLGFGQAALSLRSQFLMRPRTVNGRPVAGGVATIPISFTVEPPHTTPAPRPEPAPAPDILALARRAAATSRLADGVDTIGRVAAIRATSEDPYVSIDVRDAARQAYNAALQASLPELRERIARLYVRAFGGDELRAIADASRDSRRYNARALFERLGPSLAAVTDPLQDQITDEARARFCRVRSCTIAPLAIPPEPDA